MSADLLVGVDVGGTKVAVGLVDVDGQVLAHARAATPGGDARELASVIAGLVREVGGKPLAVGIGIAGWVDRARSRVLFAPNLSWADADIRAVVREAVGLPVVVENDANAAAWAEHRFGAGRGVDDLVAITVGTGLGGGLVMGGELQRGGFGLAGEPGHITVVPGGRRCGCGRHGCWEQYASGNALVREAQEIASVDPGAAARMLELAGSRPEGLTGPQVTQAAQEGDPAALECLEIVGRWLGRGLSTVVALLDPALIVVGGGAGEAGELILGPARRTMAQELPGAGHRPVAPIVAATLGNEAGLVGAADLARSEL
jgi:glucokinase